MSLTDDLAEGSCQHCGLPVTGGGPPSQRSFCCFGCRVAHGLALPVLEDAAGDTGGETAASAPPTTLFLRLGMGVFLTLNIMAASWLSYARDIFPQGSAVGSPGDQALGSLFAYLALFLCTGVVVLLGVPLLSAARQVPTQMLILVGVASAYILSVWHTLSGRGSLYFDTAALVLVAVTLGSHLEASAKRRAARVACRLLSVLPRQVRVRRRGEAGLGEELTADLDTVTQGDHLRFLPGDVVAVDGRVSEGSSHLDTSSLTGESQPRPVAEGSAVLAGSINLDGQLWIRAEQVGDTTVLAHMERSLERARREKPAAQRLADRVSRVFVPSVLLLAVSLLAYHAWHGQPTQGLLTALSVLLISCPCALGLAAPLATWQGLRRAAEAGILVDSAATLEQAALIDRLFFDKTGTLTSPRLVLAATVTAPGLEPGQALLQAASLEAASHHPIALAVVAEARRQGLRPTPPKRSRQLPGLGIEGQMAAVPGLDDEQGEDTHGGLDDRTDGGTDEATLALGGQRLLAAYGLTADPLAWRDDGSAAAELTNPLYLMDPQQVWARFDLHEALRPGAAAAVAHLRALGVTAEILSGDRPPVTQRLGQRLALKAEGGLLPDDKVARLNAARSEGELVAMVGDGLNDGPVLAAADLGIAMGSASELAQTSGNVRLTSDRLERIPFLLMLARHVRGRIRANLAWAFGFNSVGILLAATGRLTPVLAAVAMVLSSLVVVRLSMTAGRVIDAGPTEMPRPGVEPSAEPLAESLAEGLNVERQRV